MHRKKGPYTFLHRILIVIYDIWARFTWDQAVSVRPVRPTFFTWNFTAKHYEGKKNSNIHSKNTIKVTFTKFFDVKVRFFVTFTAFSLWRFGLFICYLHNILVVKVWIIYLLPSQHFRCEGFVFYLVLEFFTSKVFLGMDIWILFTLTVFCSEVSCVKLWSHAVSRKQFGLTWT